MPNPTPQSLLHFQRLHLFSPSPTNPQPKTNFWPKAIFPACSAAAPEAKSSSKASAKPTPSPNQPQTHFQRPRRQQFIRPGWKQRSRDPGRDFQRRPFEKKKKKPKLKPNRKEWINKSWSGFSAAVLVISGLHLRLSTKPFNCIPNWITILGRSFPIWALVRILIWK